MKRLLTDNKIKALKPKDKPYKTADGGGLYVYTTKAGAKSFRFDFKLNAKWGTVTFGIYPEITLADAREQHEQARAKLAKGLDPRQANEEENQLKPFSFYAIDATSRAELRPSTVEERLKRMQKYLFPILDKKPVTDITAIDILNICQPIADRGNRETARLLAGYCRQTFDLLLSLQLVSINPAESIRRLLPKKKAETHFAHVENKADFATLLKAIDNYHGDFAVKQALRLAPLVFLRPHNIRFLKWEYVNVADRLITIPPEHMKMNRPHKVPLSTQALDILAAMRPLTGRKELVFIGGNRDKELSENTLNQAIARAKHPQTGEPLGKGFASSHGFRHSASTMLNELGFNPDAIEIQLAHLDKDRIRRTYNKAELMPEREKMMQAWADYLDSLKNDSKIIPIKRGA